MRRAAVIAGLNAAGLLVTLSMPRIDWLLLIWQLIALGLSAWLIKAQSRLRGWRALAARVEQLAERKRRQVRAMVDPEPVTTIPLQQPGDNRLN
jgi:hypothetical protein